MSDEPRSQTTPTTRGTRDKVTAPQGAALGGTVKAGLDRAGVLAKDAADKTLDTLAGYRNAGVEQVTEDIVGYVRSQPMTAVLIATGVGLLVGMLMALGRRTESGERQGGK